jgi:hypothetical protein
VGEYSKFRRYKDRSGTVRTAAKGYLDDAWFEELGLVPVNLVYSSLFLDGKGLTAMLNAGKLRWCSHIVDS